MKKKEIMVMNLNPKVEEMEGARRATGISSTVASRGSRGINVVPDPEVPEKSSRRSFSAGYKRRILKEADVCKEQGQLGALLRREGLYYSNITTWRKQVEKGTLDALSSKKRGPKARKPDPSARRVIEQEKEIQKLRSRLRKAELIIEAQKKIAEIFQSPPRSEGRGELMIMTNSLAMDVSIKPACDALVVSRAGFYRWKNQQENSGQVCIRPLPPLALSVEEQQLVLDVLHDERFVDKAPQQVYAALLDGGSYLCSVRTMYRILEARKDVKERRNQLRHPVYTKPELLAEGPNHVWSWDITKLKGPAKWTYYYLYVILDIFSRYVVGWMVASREQGTGEEID